MNEKQEKYEKILKYNLFRLIRIDRLYISLCAPNKSDKVKTFVELWDRKVKFCENFYVDHLFLHLTAAFPGTPLLAQD